MALKKFSLPEPVSERWHCADTDAVPCPENPMKACNDLNSSKYCPRKTNRRNSASITVRRQFHRWNGCLDDRGDLACHSEGVEYFSNPVAMGRECLRPGFWRFLAPG